MLSSRTLALNLPPTISQNEVNGDQCGIHSPVIILDVIWADINGSIVYSL